MADFERHGGVHQHGAGAQVVFDGFEGGDLRAQGHGEDDDFGRFGGIRVEAALDGGTGDGGHALRGGAGAFEVPRADRNPRARLANRSASPMPSAPVSPQNGNISRHVSAIMPN